MKTGLKKNLRAVAQKQKTKKWQKKKLRRWFLKMKSDLEKEWKARRRTESNLAKVVRNAVPPNHHHDDDDSDDDDDGDDDESDEGDDDGVGNP